MYRHDGEEYSINKGKNDDNFNSKLYFSKLWRKKREVLKSNSTKQNDGDTNHGKKYSVGFKIW